MMMMMMMMMMMISSTIVDDVPCKYARNLILEIHTVFGMVGKGHSGRRLLQLG